MSEHHQFIPEIKDMIVKTVFALNKQSNWGVDAVNSDLAWSKSKGEGIKIAIIDTGWADHIDLRKNFIEAYDATGGNNVYDTVNFHGTHVAGCVAGNCEDRFGVKGVAPESKIIPIKALEGNGSGSFNYIIRALEIVRDLDVDLVNMSLGTPFPPPDDRIKDLIHDIANQGKVIVCAAGNDSGNVNYPAVLDDVIAVAALDQNNNLARFSSRGPQVDTIAPGVQIYSTWNPDTYAVLDGTSMACPIVTGMLAVIFSWYKNNPQLGFKPNVQNALGILYDLGSGDNNTLVDVAGTQISVPRFCNFDPWKVNG